MKRLRLIKARKLRGWSQAQVADRLGITPAYYGMIEQGHRQPRLPLALKMEALFGVAVSELFPDVYFDKAEELKTRSTGTDGPEGSV